MGGFSHLGNGVRAAYDGFGATSDAVDYARGFTGGSGFGSGSASELYAALTRDQWANYISTFVPIENQLIKYATDPTVVSGAMSQASQNVNDSFDAQAGVLQRRQRALGLQLTPEQQAAANRGSALSRSLADVNAQNVARDITTSRQQSILGNPVPDGGQGAR